MQRTCIGWAWGAACLVAAGCGGPSGGTDAASLDAGPPPDECAEGCLVGETCFPAGASDPASVCGICDPERSSIAFSANDGALCDDGLFCTVDDICAAGTCAGQARDCDDGIACNGVAMCNEAMSACEPGAPACSGGQICDAITGECVSDCSGCEIDGACYGDQQVDPLDPCHVCDVATSRSAWSDNDGATCDDGLFCTTGESCSAGTCGGGSARACDDGVACNGTETCDDSADSCALGVTACGANEICDVGTDACIAACTGCVIGGTCYGEGQRDPANPCQACVTASSRSDWTVTTGASCDDGLFCTAVDTCSAEGACGGTARECGDDVDCNGVETCDETADRCAAGTPTCAAGLVCDTTADACTITCGGCVVDGVCHAPGAIDATNPCRSCQIAVSTTAWTARTGSTCDDGQYCTTGETCSAAATCGGGTARSCGDGIACNGAETCNESTDRCDPGVPNCPAGQVCDTTAMACVATCSGCLIAGVCQASGAIDPSNPCRSCQTSVSTSSWSPRTGAACDDGQYCTVGETCSAAAVCTGGSARSCADAITCNGAETCNETTDRCDAGVTTCTGGQVCDTGTNMCTLMCVGGTTRCGSSCTNTSFDPANCGMCGNACGSNEVCRAGVCGALATCDSFTTADSTTVPGWTERQADWQISGGRLRHSSNGGVYSNVITRDGSTQTDGCGRLTAFATASSVQAAGVVLRWTAPGTYVVALIQDNDSNGTFDRIYIYQYPGVSDIGGSIAIPATSSADIEACVSGSTVTLRVDGDRNGTYETMSSATTSLGGAGLTGIMTHTFGAPTEVDNFCYGP
jgi:hypothetical protein